MARLALPEKGSRLPRLRLSAGAVGGAILLTIALGCLLTLPWSIQRYDEQGLSAGVQLVAPSLDFPFGTDRLGRSLLWRCLLGGAISLGVGAAAAAVAVVIGVAVGAAAGYVGGRTDALLMRAVDVLYGLPYILLVVLIDLALEPTVARVLGWFTSEYTAGTWAGLVTLLLAIGSVSWLTMARVIRGQVLSLKAQPFVEAARACGYGPGRVLTRHLLPNLVSPIIVYATLTVPAAILQESFLSFLGIGVQAPLPSWGNLASEGIGELAGLGQGLPVRWWLLFWPCVLLALTLMSLNFLGDAWRARWDPKARSRR